jgi:hypothetical protein
MLEASAGETPFHDRRRVAERVLEVEEAVELRSINLRHDLGVAREVLPEAPLPAPRPHRVPLNPDVALLPGDARLDEREEHGLREVQLGGAIEVGLHPLGVDDESFDDSACAVEHEGEARGRVRCEHPLGRGMRDVALVPERDVLERRDAGRADDSRETAEVLGEDRVSLVGHRARPLLPDSEGLLRFADLAPLPVADVGREPLDSGGDEAHRAEQLGVAVAGHDLGRDGLRSKTERAERPSLDRRGEVSVGPHGACNLSVCDRFPCADETLASPDDLRVVTGEDDAERERLGEDPVTPTDHRCLHVLPRAPGESGGQRLGPLDEEIGRVAKKDRERGIEDVTRCHPAMKPARVRSGELLDVGEKRDHVVLHRPLDLVDPGDVEDELLRPEALRDSFRNQALGFHCFAGGELDLEPDREPAFGGPEGGELGRRVARDHRGRP